MSNMIAKSLIEEMPVTHTKCAECGKPLIDFMIYLPDLGQCCMDCYREYALTIESNTS